jgi:hypothetical protein
MKKIFTLLFCTAIISSAFAFDGHHGERERNFVYINRDHEEFRQPERRAWNEGYVPRSDGYFRRTVVGFGPGWHVNFIAYGNSQYPIEQRDALIAQIESDYNYRIQQVENDYYLSPEEINYQVNNLEMQEQQAIDNIYAQCGLPVPVGLRISLGRRFR